MTCTSSVDVDLLFVERHTGLQLLFLLRRTRSGGPDCDRCEKMTPEAFGWDPGPTLNSVICKLSNTAEPSPILHF